MKSQHLAPLALAACFGLAVPASAQDTLLDKLVKKIVKPARKAAPADVAPAGRAGSVSHFDIAGVRLGMTPVQTRAALIAAGFKPRASDPDQDSWEAKLAGAVAKRRPNTRTVTSKVPMFTMASGPRGEHLEVWYNTDPAGATAGSIKYTIPSEQMTGAAFYQGVLEKYGSPTIRQYGQDMLYCSAGEAAKDCVTWTNKRRPYLHAEADYSLHTLYLAGGTEASDANKAAFAAEVERRAPKDAKPSF